MAKRVLLAFDGRAWYLRGILTIAHDLDQDHIVYRCDQHLGGPFKTARAALAALTRRSRRRR